MSFKLSDLNKDLQILLYRNTIQIHKRFELLLATENVKQIRAIMETCILQKRSTLYMIRQITLAAKNVYQPKKFSQHDTDLAILLLRIGGPCLLYASTRDNSLPSASFTYKVFKFDIKMFNLVSKNLNFP